MPCAQWVWVYSPVEFLSNPFARFENAIPFCRNRHRSGQSLTHATTPLPQTHKTYSHAQSNSQRIDSIRQFCCFFFVGFVFGNICQVADMRVCVRSCSQISSIYEDWLCAIEWMCDNEWTHRKFKWKYTPHLCGTRWCHWQDNSDSFLDFDCARIHIQHLRFWFVRKIVAANDFWFRCNCALLWLQSSHVYRKDSVFR